MVEKNSCALASLHDQGEVERSRGVEGVQLDVGVGSCQLNCRQVLAALARVAWVALAGVGRGGGGKAGAMSARGSLAWRRLLVGCNLECRKVKEREERQKTALPPQWGKTHKKPLSIRVGKGKMVVLLQGWCSVLHAGGEMFLLVNP